MPAWRPSRLGHAGASCVVPYQIKTNANVEAQILFSLSLPLLQMSSVCLMLAESGSLWQKVIIDAHDFEGGLNISKWSV